MSPTSSPARIRSKNLQLANKIRCEHAALQRSIRSGEVDVVDVLLENESGIKLVDVLRAIPRVGDAARERLLDQAGIPHTLRLGGAVSSSFRPATERERSAIAEVIDAFLQRQANGVKSREAVGV